MCAECLVMAGRAPPPIWAISHDIQPSKGVQDGEELQNNHKPKEGVAPLEFPSSPFCNSGENMMGPLSGESVFRCLAVQTVLKSLDRRGFKTALIRGVARTAFPCKILSLAESSAFPGTFLRTICTVRPSEANVSRQYLWFRNVGSKCFKKRWAWMFIVHWPLTLLSLLCHHLLLLLSQMHWQFCLENVFKATTLSLNCIDKCFHKCLQDHHLLSQLHWHIYKENVSRKCLQCLPPMYHFSQKNRQFNLYQWPVLAGKSLTTFVSYLSWINYPMSSVDRRREY